MWKARHLIPFAVGLLLACSSGSPSNVGESADSLRHADEDATTRAVVFISTGCTGTLIAPNLVLTARHCVAVDDESAPIVDGCRGVFTKPIPGAFFVSPVTTVEGTPLERFTVKQVRVAPLDKGRIDIICGHDRALLILDGNIREADITPLALRLDRPAERGEAVSVVGYGATGDENKQDLFRAFTRRRINDGEVLCLGVGCHATEHMTTNEMTVAAPVCKGDSGGPVLDRQEQVIGIVSRGVHELCGVAEVFEDVYSAREWISTVALEAATLGSYPVPDWSVPITHPVSDSQGPSRPENVNRTLGSYEATGCSASPTAPSSFAVLLLLGSFFGWMLLSRRVRLPRGQRSPRP